MKKYTFFIVCCLVSLIAAATVSAQGITGPGVNPPSPPNGGPDSNPSLPPSQLVPGVGFTGPWTSGQYGYGFTGPSQIVPVAQAQSYGYNSPVIIQGNIVQAIGGDLYMFRDSSGDMLIKIGPKEWLYYGAAISPSDTIEISGEVHRSNKNWLEPPHVHAKFIRKI